MNIRFKCDDKGTAINLPEKHAKLLEILQSIDVSTYFSDANQNACEDPNTLLQCKIYDNTFTIDIYQRNAGNIYVQCNIFSKLKINQFKHGEKNIMQYLKDQNIFITFRKFTQETEVKIGFFPLINPDTFLRSELRETLNYALTQMKLTTKDKEALESDITQDPTQAKTVTFPAYELLPTSIGFGNGSTRITTRVIEMRFDPEDANVLKKLITIISNSSTNDIEFMPSRLVQIIGPEAYKKILGKQNHYCVSL